MRQLAARLLKARTPSPRLYAAYRESADAFYWAHRGSGPPFRANVPDGHQLTARPALRYSVLFGREYLVAWVDDNEAFARAFRDTDAITTPIPTPIPTPFPWESAAIPLILAPERRRDSRSRSFLSILEHEIVHANQLIVGLSFPEFETESQDELLDRFFSHTRLEFETHLIQSAHWPPKLTFGSIVLELDEWAILRAYTPAIEEVFGAVVAGRIPANILPEFLDAVPRAAPPRLRRVGCGRELVTWFRTRWTSDVATAGLRVLQSTNAKRNRDLARVVHGWLQARASGVAGLAQMPPTVRRRWAR